MTNYGYARVSRSTDDGGDTLENQRRRLNLAGVENQRIYEDSITGIVFRRPGLDALLSRLEASDAVVVTALDRLGRDTLGILELIHQLGAREIELRILDTLVDTQDAEGGGRLLALVAAEIAQIEREKISRRTTAGLERARAEGKLTGRRWSISRCPASTIFAGWRQSVLPVHLLGLAPLLGSVGPVAGDVKLQDDGVVHDPVNRRGGGHGVGKDAFPLREDQV